MILLFWKKIFIAFHNILTLKKKKSFKINSAYIYYYFLHHLLCTKKEAFEAYLHLSIKQLSLKMFNVFPDLQISFVLPISESCIWLQIFEIREPQRGNQQAVSTLIASHLSVLRDSFNSGLESASDSQRYQGNPISPVYPSIL